MIKRTLRAAAIAGAFAASMVAAVALLAWFAPAAAQGIGGNASVTSGAGSSARVAMPANQVNFPSVILAPAFGSSAEIFYKFGTVTVTADATSPALPSGGICVNSGSGGYVAVFAASAQTVRVTQVSGCTNFASAGGSSGGGATQNVEILDQNGVPVDYTTPTPTTQSTLTPTGATQISAASGDVAAAVATAALAGTSGKTTYISGFSITGGGITATGAVIVCTLTGVVTGTLTFDYGVPIGAAVGAPPLIVPFNPPLAAITTNTPISASCPSFGVGNTHAAVNAWGYQQ